jgi:hypothetical protein
MNKFRFTIKVFAIAIFMFAFASLAQAQATRTWVSGVGDDANPCSRTAPCKTFAGSISKTAVGGEINCLDSGGFGSVTITKSMTIKCEGVIGGVLAAGTFGININDSGSATPGTAIVTISGLDIEGFGTGTNGIQFISGGVLHVHKTQIRNFRQSGAGGNGISFTPSSGAPKLFVADSYITDNGSTSTTGGIVVRPTGTGNANVTINRTQIENNSSGIIADGSSSTGIAVNVSVRDCLVGGSGNDGIAGITIGGHAGVGGTVENTMVTANVGSGISANGAAVSGSGSAIIHVDRSAITLNVAGITNTGAGQVRSFTTNLVSGNLGSEVFAGNDLLK